MTEKTEKIGKKPMKSLWTFIALVGGLLVIAWIFKEKGYSFGFIGPSSINSIISFLAAVLIGIILAWIYKKITKKYN